MTAAKMAKMASEGCQSKGLAAFDKNTYSRGEFLSFFQIFSPRRPSRPRLYPTTASEGGHFHVLTAFGSGTRA